MKLVNTLIFLSLFSGLSLAQDVTIRGFVTDKANGEPMPFEKVKLLKADSSVVTGAVTDVDGIYSIAKIAHGNYIIQISNPSYNDIYHDVKVINATGIMNINFEMEKRTDVVEIEQVTISAESIQKKNEVQISTIKLDKKGIERIPSMGAENDIIGAFSVTPGVVTTGDQGGQLYVRGGTPIQNKILLDGMTVYTPFHSIGFFSIFETELVQNVDIYTGGFDAQYGGRISSIMDISYRDGNKKEMDGLVSLSPFMGKLVLEGPFKKNKDGSPSAGSYIFSAKKSLIDISSKTLYPSINRDEETGEVLGMPFNFTDVYGKMSFKGKGGSKFSTFGFHNRDRVNYDIADLNWQQTGFGMNFLLVPGSSPVIVKGHANGSQFMTQFDEKLTSGDTISRTSGITGFDLGFDFTYFLKNESEINYGFNFGGFNTEFLTYNEIKQRIEQNNSTAEVGAYFNYRIVTNRWVVQPSFRMQYYPALTGGFSPEPRLGLKYNATEKLRFKASGGRFSQNFTSASSDKDIVNLFNGLLSAPNNVQSTFVTQFQNTKNPVNGLQIAWHGIVGFEYDLTKRLSMNVEGYYKYFSQLSNINQNKIYPDTDQFSDIDDIYKKDFILENGTSYGIDLLLKYSSKKLYIWGVYSYGYNTRWDGFEEYFPVFDRRHNVNFVGTYLFGKNNDLEVSIRWNLGTGLPFTPTAGNYESQTFTGGVTTDYTTDNADNVSTILGEFNSERLTAYHRLDLTVKKKFQFKNKTELEIIGSITNLYDRKNIFYINRVTQETIYQFPILPSIGLNYDF